jgi:hypothetical protein
LLAEIAPALWSQILVGFPFFLENVSGYLERSFQFGMSSLGPNVVSRALTYLGILVRPLVLLQVDRQSQVTTAAASCTPSLTCVCRCESDRFLPEEAFLSKDLAIGTNRSWYPNQSPGLVGSHLLGTCVRSGLLVAHLLVLFYFLNLQ